MTNARLKPVVVMTRVIRFAGVTSCRSSRARTWNTIGATTIKRPTASTSAPSNVGGLLGYEHQARRRDGAHRADQRFAGAALAGWR